MDTLIDYRVLYNSIIMKGTFAQIRDLIIKDQIEDALDMVLLIEDSNDAVILFSRWHSIQKSLLNNTVHKESADIEMNSIKLSILKLLRDIFSKRDNSEQIAFTLEAETMEKANEYYYQSKYVEAIVEYKRILELDPNNETALYRISSSLFMLKAYDQCIEKCDLAIQMIKGTDKFYNLIGVTHSSKSNHALALNFFERALNENPKSELFFQNVFFTLKKLDRIDGQLDLCDKYIRLYPNKSFYYFKRANLFSASLKQYEEALSNINIAIAYNPNNPEYYYERAAIYAKLKYLDLSLADISTAYQLVPDLNYIIYKGAIYHDFRKFEEARKTYSEVIAKDPNNYNIYYNRADSLYNLKEYQSALKDINYFLSKIEDHSESFALKEAILKFLP